MVRILLRNVMGVHSKRAIFFEAFVMDWRFDLICLEETKLLVLVTRSICDCVNLGFVFKRAIGSFGRLLILWNKEMLKLDLSSIDLVRAATTTVH